MNSSALHKARVAEANRRRSKSVRRARDGVEFPSVRAAAIAEGCSAQAIHWLLRYTRRWGYAAGA